MSVLWVQLIAMFSVLISATILPVTLADRRKLRSYHAKVDRINDPLRLQQDAHDMAKHAIEYNLPTMPWYQLAGFWGRVTGDEPEIIGAPKHPLEMPVVTGGPNKARVVRRPRL